MYYCQVGTQNNELYMELTFVNWLGVNSSKELSLNPVSSFGFPYLGSEKHVTSHFRCASVFGGEFCLSQWYCLSFGFVVTYGIRIGYVPSTQCVYLAYIAEE